MANSATERNFRGTSLTERSITQEPSGTEVKRVLFGTASVVALRSMLR